MKVLHMANQTSRQLAQSKILDWRDRCGRLMRGGAVVGQTSQKQHRQRKDNLEEARQGIFGFAFLRKPASPSPLRDEGHLWSHRRGSTTPPSETQVAQEHRPEHFCNGPENRSLHPKILKSEQQKAGRRWCRREAVHRCRRTQAGGRSYSLGRCTRWLSRPSTPLSQEVRPRLMRRPRFHGSAPLPPWYSFSRVTF